MMYQLTFTTLNSIHSVSTVKVESRDIYNGLIKAVLPLIPYRYRDELHQEILSKVENNNDFKDISAKIHALTWVNFLDIDILN